MRQGPTPPIKPDARAHEPGTALDADGLDATKRAFLAALVAADGGMLDATRAVGIDESTPHTSSWRGDPVYQAALATARATIAERYRQLAVAACTSRRYKHSKSGVPLPHPELCDCGHAREGHLVLPEAEAWDDRGPCSSPGCGCARLIPAPYFEDVVDMRAVELLLKAALPGEFNPAQRLEVSALIGQIDLDRLPDAAVERIARGESAIAVLASIAAEGGQLPEGLAEALGVAPKLLGPGTVEGEGQGA